MKRTHGRCGKEVRILAVAALLAAGVQLGAVQVAGETDHQVWSVRLIQVTVEDKSGQPMVMVRTQGRPRFSLAYLHQPERALLKLNDTLLTWKPPQLESGQDPLRGVRAAQHGRETWVVLDLSQPGKWQATGISQGVALSPAHNQAASAEESAQAMGESGQSLPAFPALAGNPDASSQVVDVVAQNLGDKTRVTITLDNQARYRLERLRNGRDLRLEIFGAGLVWRGPLNGPPGSVVQRVNARPGSEAGEPIVEMELQLSQAAAFEVNRAQNQIVVEIVNPAGVARPGRGNPAALVSADLQNAELETVLRALAQEAGFDLVITPGSQNLPEAQGQITLSINRQPLHAVLDLILRPRQLAYTLSGNTLRVGQAAEFPLETLVFTLKNAEAKNADLKSALEQALTPGSKGQVIVDEAANRVIVTAVPGDMARIRTVIRGLDRNRQTSTRSFALSYTQAGKILPLVQGALSSLGSIRENQAENSLVVTDIPGSLATVAGLIQKLDTRAQQVMIEARIVEVSRSQEHGLGINWSAISEPSRQPRISAQSNPALVAGPALQLAIGTLQTGMNLNATLTALEAKGVANTISNPRIATLNNQSATLRASQNIPYATSRVSNGVVSNGVEYLELPITLTVVPQITRERRVMLNPLTLSVATVTKEGTPPTTSTRTATTQMMMRDGETIALGGMVRDELITRESKVPVLGDVPLLGYLFKSETASKNKIELVVFLTTHILE